MRFTTAIAIVAQGFVSAKELTGAQLLRNHALTKTRGHHHHPGRISGRAQSYRSRALKQKSPLDVIKSKITELRSPRKCDPTEADAGILATCSPEEYCSDIGVCTPKGAKIRKASSNETTTDDFIVDIVEDLVDLLTTESYYYNYFCNKSSPIYRIGAEDGDAYNCDCFDIDIAKQAARIRCSIPEECDGELCYTPFFAVVLDGNFSEYESRYVCQNFTSPYGTSLQCVDGLPPLWKNLTKECWTEQKICYYYGYTDDPSECSISINEVDCDSCMLEAVSTDESISDCITFDCTNIAIGNAGVDCKGDFVSDIYESLSTLFPVDATVSFLQTIIFGISRMSVEEQIEWATLTAEYIVQYYDTIAQDILRDLIVVIEVVAVMPRAGNDGRRLHELVDSVKVIYNTDLNYLIEDPSLISPEEIARLPFFSVEDRAAYVEFMNQFGSGNLANITAIESLGQIEALRPDKSAKKSKSTKSSKKSSKGSKTSDKSSKKSTKSAKSERNPIYLPPTIEDIDMDADFEDFMEESLVGSGSESKKGKKRRY